MRCVGPVRHGWGWAWPAIPSRIRAGASLVQLYSAMVFEGPGLPRRILKGMEQLMQRDGFASIAEAVGSE